MSPLEIIWALLFVASSGLLFNQRFRGNAFLVVCAGLIALASTYFLTRQIVDQIVSERLPSQSAPTPTRASLPNPKPGTIFKDCSDCPAMMALPAGGFMMGSPTTEPGHSFNEGPLHRVTIAKNFAVGKYEITRREYGEFVSATSRDDLGACSINTGNEPPNAPPNGRNWRNPGFPQTPDDPVVCVSWEDVEAYVIWLSSKTGQSYRLLSEAEWEYSARGGNTEGDAYYWGPELWKGCSYVNGADLTAKAEISTWPAILNCEDGHVYTAPVGSFAPNNFGLYDMLGNVWEWTEDCWALDYKGAPADGSARQADGSSCRAAGRVNRGGAWGGYPQELRCASRNWGSVITRSIFIGFRVARDMD